MSKERNTEILNKKQDQNAKIENTTKTKSK